MTRPLWTAFFVCLLGGVAPLGFATGSGSDSSSLQARATRLYQDGRLNEALPLYQRLAQLRPHDIVVTKNLMWIFWKTGDMVGTAETATRATTLLPDDIESWNLLAQASDANGDWKEAIHAYRKELALEPQNDGVRMALARLYLNIKDDDSAISMFERVVQRNPTSVDSYAALAQIYFYKGSYELSLDNWKKALQMKPANTQYQFGQAKTLYYSGKPDAAVAQMKMILAAHPDNRDVADFLTDDALASQDMASAQELLSSRLTEFRPQDELRILQLIEVLQSRGEWEKSIAVLKRYLNVNPNNGQALLSIGDALNEVHRSGEATSYYERVLEKNPASLRAMIGLADTYLHLSKTRKAIDILRRARQLDPTNPTLLLRMAQVLQDAQDFEASRKLLTEWLSQQKGPLLPVLLYHGLTPFPRDTLLAYSVHMSTISFENQMKAIHDAGYNPVTAQQVNDWYHHDTPLPTKPIMITFDDARVDSFRYADPILEKYNLRATMFAHTRNVDENLPGHASWDELKRYHATPRWEIESHGDLAHDQIQIDADGRTGIFLANKIWLTKENRFETLDEWRHRIDADHVRSTRKIKDSLGVTPIAISWPEGNYGQDSVPNSPEAAAINLEIVRQHFGLAFQQDEFGINLRSRDPMLVSRLQPSHHLSGKDLVHTLQNSNPIARAHRLLVQQSIWENHIREAKRWLAALKADGVDPAVILVEEARLEKAGGQEQKAVTLAKQALLLENSADNRRFLEDMLIQKNGGWTAGVLYQKDNQRRESAVFEQSLDVAKTGPLRWSLLQHFGRYFEPFAPSVSDIGGGASVRWTLPENQQLLLRADGHAFSQRVKDEGSVHGQWDAQWTKGWSSQVGASRAIYDSARAIDAGVIDRFGQATVQWQDPETWRVALSGAAHSLSDGNARYTNWAEADRTLGWKPLQAIVRSTYDRMNRISPNYYSPQDLQIYQAGLEFSQPLSPTARMRLRYLPGVGKEDSTRWELAQEVTAGLSISVGRLSIEPSYVYYRTPTYRNNSYFLGLGLPF